MQRFKFDAGLMEKILEGGIRHGGGYGGSTPNGGRDVCIEQAVSMCLGIQLTDHPDTCVAAYVSGVGRGLNDANWSSNEARAAGLRKYAYAQLGTEGINNSRFLDDLHKIIQAELKVAGYQAAFRLTSELGGKRRDRMLCAIADMAIRAIRMQVPEEPYNIPPPYNKPPTKKEETNAKAEAARE